MENALDLLPEFERKFIKPQWNHMLYHKYKTIKEKRKARIEVCRKPSSRVDVHDTWMKDIELSDIWLKTTEGLQEAEKVRHGSYIPASPPIFSSTDRENRNQIKNITK